MKCEERGLVGKDLFKRPKAGWKLRIQRPAGNGEIEIAGNQAGLEYLASCCLRIIARKEPAGHFHLEVPMCNLSEGSIPVVFRFDRDGKGRIPYAATGKAIDFKPKRAKKSGGDS